MSFYKSTTRKESHHSVIAEPDHLCINHVTPSSGKAVNTAEVIIELIKLSDTDPFVLGCDDTPTNDGCHGEVNILIELSLGKFEMFHCIIFKYRVRLNICWN